MVEYNTKGKREVEANDVLNDIAKGEGIFIEDAVIKGDLDIRRIADRLDRDEDGKLVIQSRIVINYCKISGNANFAGTIFSVSPDFHDTTFDGVAYFGGVSFNGIATFSGASFNSLAYFGEAFFNFSANFSGATFSMSANFAGTIFSVSPDFRETTFDGVANFAVATFNGYAVFSGAAFWGNALFDYTTMEHPANFSGVRFHENTVSAGIWNHILRPAVRFISRTEVWLLNRVADFIPIIPVAWFRSIPTVELPEMPVTNFLNFNTITVMDGSSNPYLKRYIDDEQWIASWRKHGGRWKRFLFILWELTSHCGRSIKLWAGWSTFIAVYFACMYYWKFGCDRIAFNVDRLKEVQPDFLDYLYYSVVTFTTLGFGDIVPLDKGARLVVGAEVILGYVMLGGL